MRDFFINALEKIIAVVIVLLMVGVVITAIIALFEPTAGIFASIMILIAGGLYVILMGGMMYLGLGIYHNTLQTAKTTQALLDRQD